MARLSLLPLCFAVALLGLATVHAGSSRLVERELRLPGYQLADDVPIVDPPRRTAGYFRLNRTKAAEVSAAPNGVTCNYLRSKLHARLYLPKCT